MRSPMSRRLCSVTRPTSPHIAQGTRRRRGPWWRQPATAPQIFVSVLALVVAAASYWDQNHANALAAETATRADASAMSFWQAGNGDIVLQNSALSPMQDVTLTMQIGTFRSLSLPKGRPGEGTITTRGTKLRMVQVDIGAVPPCTQEELLLTKDFPAVGGPGNFVAMVGDSIGLPPVLTFTDENGHTWRDNGFSITTVASTPFENTQYQAQIADQHVVQGCG
jgi:hypothetical protein